MKILETNLKHFIDIPNDINEITNDYITEVEEFGPYVNINNLVIGKVLEKEKHENADTLSVTKVDLGNGRIEQIVCGAPNVDKGQYVIVATEGAILPGDFKIKKSKIRGVESNGMICSLNELGFNEKLIPEKFKSGIYYFSEEKEVGSNALVHLGMDGFLMELSLTPNRSDLLSHYGFAQDLAAALNTKIKLPKVSVNEMNKENPIKVKIESKNTNSYFARYFDSIKVSESPMWLKNFLLSMDCQPINNVVDITNYILYTYGIPMHAFDANKFGSKEVVVRDNTKKQAIKTLDGIERTINNNEILITNGKEAMALGGVMGLENSMITNSTTSIILEVASFNPSTIRETSKSLNLKSDSSLRFERGIDEEMMEIAINHAAMLLEELASAKTYKGVSKDIKNKFVNNEITLDMDRLNKKIGNDLSEKEVLDILARLNYKFKNDKKIVVQAPTYRNDILMFDDVIEEVVRIYGMNNITNKPVVTKEIGGLTNKQKTNRKIRHYLASLGLNEVVTYSLLKYENVQKYNNIGEIISILKPMSQDKRSLRQSLINGMLETVKYNRDRSIENINLFEMGHVYAKDFEHNYLTIMLTTNPQYNTWKNNDTNVDFYYLSGILKNIMELLNASYELKVSNYESLHPYQQADIIVNKKIVGKIAKIHPKDYVKGCFALELDLDLIDKTNKFKYELISKYPNVERDIAIVLKEEIEINSVLKLIEQTTKKQLVKLEVFDIYKGQHIEKGYQSVAVRMVFNDKEKTLESTDVDKLVLKIVKRIEFEFDGKIRS